MLLWLDLETTGLDPHHPDVDCRDVLLEVAAIGTDPDLREVTEPFHRVVLYSPAQAQRLRTHVADDYVRAMHDTSGLWDLLVGGTDLDQIDTDLVDFIDSFAPGKRAARIAGNSVSSLDVPFSQVYLPRAASKLHYRVLDVSSISYAATIFGITSETFSKKKTHRALDDIRESIAELAWLRDLHRRA